MSASLFYISQLSFCLFAGFLTTCCTKGSNDIQAFNIKDTVIYDVASGTGQNFIILNSAKGIVSNQELIIDLTAQNESGKPLNLNPSLWEITTSDGTRTTPFKTNTEDIVLLENEERKIALHYAPVHNRQLYQQTTLRGDLNEGYTLKATAFIATDTLTQTFKIGVNPNLLNASIDSLGMRNSVMPYVFSENIEFKENQTDCLSEIFKDRNDPNIQLSENEILMNGVWMKVQMHHRDDTLHINLRVVNQAEIAIGINASGIFLIHDGKSIQNSFGSQQTIDVSKGRRAALQLKYVVPQIDKYEVNFKGIGSADESATLFCMPIEIKRLANF